ncbi:MAG: Fic family protein [Deltaproteobacteria bacterium]|nr:Fic family protein [Deltaproteobacteria bacterium]
MGRAGNFINQPKGYKAFQPTPLPPDPPLAHDEELTLLAAQATLAVGKLSGLSTIIPDPDLFVYLYVRKEALLSSQIEGTQCSLEDILNPDAKPISNNSNPKDIEEVSNYVKAMNQGLARLVVLPVSTRLIKEIHSTLMRGVRGSDKTPGEFRRSQNWIGRPGATLSTAEFVPPPPEEVDRLMSELEKFIHAIDRTPPLIKAALIHAQFETIHPFLDGNGRLGRLLITFLLVHWKVLEKPLLYISYYFKANRTEYYSRLMDIRMRGDWESWVKFFLRAARESAEMGAESATEIHNLMTSDRARIQSADVTSTTLFMYHHFCREPILTNSILVTKMKSSKPTVQRALEHLLKLGIIAEVSGKQRRRRYSYTAYLNILTRDTTTRIG